MARSRSIFTSLTRLFDASSQPIYLLDDQRRIVYCNEACEKWLVTKAEEFVGQTCNYHSGDSPHLAVELAAALCPPPAVFQGQRQQSVTVVRLPEGAMSQRRTQFEPLIGENEALLGVLAIVAARDESTAANSLCEDAVDSPEQLHAQLQSLRASWQRRFRSDRMVGTSLVAAQLREKANCAVETHCRTLIIGPPGSGCQHIARTIHHARGATVTDSPLLPIDCRLMDEELMRAVTDSLVPVRRQSNPEAVTTLLLLDVDLLTPDAQNGLASYGDLASRRFTTLATAQTSLVALAAQGRFRQDLAFLLSTFVMEVPPLAERREDIALLAQTFLEDANQAGAKQLSGFTPDALRLLANYPWPRNADELAEVVREACVKADSVLVGTVHLPPHIHAAADAATRPRRPDPPIEIDAFLADVEKELLTRALRQAKGNKAKAAKLLGMNRVRLLRRMGQLGIE